MNQYCIVNTFDSNIADRISEYGYQCISVEKSPNVSGPISVHADVLYLKTGKKDIYVSDCQQNNMTLLKKLGYNIHSVKLSPGYSTECKLNMVVTDKTIICNPKNSIKPVHFCKNREIINVNQGYTKCSTIVLSDNDFITEDVGIYNALLCAGKNCLLLEKGYVELEGYDYGFIGGASIFFENCNKLFFTGDISRHPDFNIIMEFCNKIGIVVEWINDMILTDIGGAVIL